MLNIILGKRVLFIIIFIYLIFLFGIHPNKLRAQTIPLEKPILISPHSAITENNPVFVWRPVSGATWYKLLVWDDYDQPVISQWHKQSVCDEGTNECRVTSETVLNIGHYQWWVQGSDGTVSGPWSQAMYFTVYQRGASPQIYYVAANGDDYNSGSAQSPWLTIQRGVIALYPGDALYIKAGTYAPFKVLSSGLVDGLILITAVDNEVVTVQGGTDGILVHGDYVTVQNLNLAGGSDTWWGAMAADNTQGVKFINNSIGDTVGDHGIVFYQSSDFSAENNTVKNTAVFGIRSLESHHGTIANNQVEHSGYQLEGDDGSGIVIHKSSDILIENNSAKDSDGNGILVELESTGITIKHNETLNNGWAGIWLAGGTHQVEGNTIYGNTGGIWLSHNTQNVNISRNTIIYNNHNWPSATKGSAGIWLRGAQGTQIYHNVIYGNGFDYNNAEGTTGGIVIGKYWGSGTDQVADTKIVNNIISFNIGSEIKAYSDEINFPQDIHHNLLYQDTADILLVEWGETNYAQLGEWQQATGYGIESLQQDPLFIDPQLADFHLLGNSPAINAGVDLGETYIGSAPDLGVYEQDSALCQGDFNQDHQINLDDLIFVLEHWGNPDGYQVIDASALILVLKYWNQPC